MFDEKVSKVLIKEGLWNDFSKLDNYKLDKSLIELDPKLKKKIEKLETKKVSEYPKLLVKKEK